MNKVTVNKVRVPSGGNGQSVSVSTSGGGSGGSGGPSVNLDDYVKKTGDTMSGSLETPTLVTPRILSLNEDGSEGELDIDANTNINGDTVIKKHLDINPDASPDARLTFAGGNVYHHLNANSILHNWIAKDFTSVTIATESIKVSKNITSSDFVQGLTGKGSSIWQDKYGKWHEEIDSLTIREFLEVPELRFNRVDVVGGELWNAIAFGTIESVDKINQIATVKLLDGELLSSHVNDICRGIFYNIGSDKDTDDGNGFKQMQGFGTAYFTPKEILTDGKSFRYELQSGSTFHPCKAMKFVAYGNFSDVTRQVSVYHTRTYTRYLEKVNTWAIDPDRNIVAQYGDIDGLAIGGVTMKGTGSFQKNSYLSGVQIQFTPEQKEDLKGDDAYSVSLSSYEGVIKMSGDGTIASTLQEYNVISEDTNVISGNNDLTTTSYILSTRIQAFKGIDELTFAQTPSMGNYIVVMRNVGCSAVVNGGVLYILSVEDKDLAYVNLTVNCEGNAIFDKRYSIAVLSDGKDGADGKYTVAQYKVSVAIPTGEGSTTPPEVTTGKFLWMRTGGVTPPAITPSLWSNYVRISGEVGEVGADGKLKPYYDYSFAYSTQLTTHDATTAPIIIGSWSDTPPNAVTGAYLWQRVIYYTVKSDNSGWVILSGNTKYSRLGGDSGQDGGNTASVMMYQRKSSKPSNPSSGVMTYTFSTSKLTGTPNNGWSVTIPNGDESLWIVSAVAYSNTYSDAIQPNEWSEAVMLSANGSDGKDGLNTAIITLYKRSSSVPSIPTTALTYTFSTGLLSGELSGWSQKVPQHIPYPLYVITAMAVSLSDSDTIPTSEWSEAHIIVEDGRPGEDGKDGKGYEFIYKRTTTDSKPTSPESVQTDDDVPTGWTDDATGVNETMPYEWTCKRVKMNGVWGVYSNAALWAKYAFDGKDGIKGDTGADGTQYYTWMRYSDYADGTSNDNNSNRPYLGIAVNKLTPIESNDKTEYNWSRIEGGQGIPGTPGINGETTYTWIKYADDILGNGLSNNGTNKKYIGFAYNKLTKIESNIPSDYKWTLFRGEDGKDGKEHEFIFRRTTTDSKPTTPDTVQKDDYVPIYWTDDAVGVDSSMLYEWTCKRVKEDGVWGEFSTPALWAKYSFDGDTGAPAVMYLLIPSVTQIGCNSLGTLEPSSFSVSLYSKTGDAAQQAYKAYIALWVYNGSSWTRRALVFGSSIDSGSLGSYKQYCIKAYGSTPASFDTESIATVSVNVVKDGEDGEDGRPGEPGKDGENIASGTMIRNRGEIKLGEKYYWNKEYRDVGYFPNGGVNEIYVVNRFSIDGYVTSNPLTDYGDSKGWKKGNKSDFSAFDLVVIDDAFIENLGVSTVKTKGKEGILNINGKDSFIEIESESKSKVFQFGVQNSNTGTNSPWAGLIMRQYLPYTNKDPNKMRGDSTLLPGTLWVSRISADVEHIGTPPVLIENSVTSYPNIESAGSGIIVRKIASINKKHNNVLQGLVAIVYCCTGEWTIYNQWSSSEYKHASNKLNIVFNYASIAPGKAEVKMQNCPFTYRDQYHVIATTNIPRGGGNNGYVGIVDKVSDGFVIVTGTNTGLVNAQVTFFIIASDGYF